MNISFFIMIIVVILSAGYISFLSNRNKHTIEKMTSMTLGMSIGMITSLLIGTLLGVMLKGNLFMSTILSMAICVVFIYIITGSLGILTMVESIMSAMMGGMMGAMLGDMVATQYADTLIKILFTLYVFTISLIICYVFHQNSKRIRYLQNPFIYAIIMASFFVLFHQLGPVVNTANNNFSNNHQLHQNPTSNSTQYSGGNSNAMVISSEEYQYTPYNFSIKKGQTVTLRLENKGKIEHDLEFKQAKGIKVQSRSAHHHEGNNALHLHATPGKTSQVTVTFTQDGIYNFYCTLPSHEQLGMKGTITVDS
ncbi:plastocyanin/azurin family copper-binding protein [Priestia aryabhattai]|uniref:plastocyanin/azurin family copper-binding protein n=1 Tax=Priestia aryabhattai TaxID=412384 RepID=UPI00203E9820|nr:plastocyanin/azurin family copper-binding protein [Priestia aryabhattai]MCM3252539.1 plastocyanin/azurin family copper-binding protein [Priestia aryabhattai]